MKIQRLGKYDRYVVLNDDGRYWAGICWASALREARVFAEMSKAEKVVRILSKQERDIRDGHQYAAEIIVKTSSDQWVPLQELRETLARYVSVINEIEGDVHVLDVEIDWESLREHEA